MVVTNKRILFYSINNKIFLLTNTNKTMDKNNTQIYQTLQLLLSFSINTKNVYLYILLYCCCCYCCCCFHGMNKSCLEFIWMLGMAYKNISEYFFCLFLILYINCGQSEEKLVSHVEVSIKYKIVANTQQTNELLSEIPSITTHTSIFINYANNNSHKPVSRLFEVYFEMLLFN